MTSFDSTMDLYRQMAANIPDCSIYIFNENYEYLLAEGEEIAKNGFSSEMLVGSNFFEVWPEEVTTTLASYYQDTLKGIRQKMERESETGYFIQHFIPIINSQGNVLAGMVVSQNISVLTETRQKLNDTSKELRTKEQLLETVINSLSEGIIVSDKQGKVLLTNPATREMLGVDTRHKDINDIGKQLIIKTSADSAELLNHEMPLNIALHGGELNGYVTYVENRLSRQKLFVENTSRPILNEEGGVEAALLVMRNISLRKELEDLVDENLHTLKEKNERLENLLQDIAKTLRGPVANINILLSLLEKTEDEGEKELFLTKIKGSSRLLERSVNSMSTAIMGFTSIQEEWVLNNFDDVISGFRTEFKKQMQEEDVHLKTDFNKVPAVIFPANLMKGIIFNILSNILQFCRKDAGSQIALRTSEENKEVKLHVAFSNIDLDLDQVFSEETDPIGKSTDFNYIGFFMAKNHLKSVGGRLVTNDKRSLTLSF